MGRKRQECISSRIPASLHLWLPAIRPSKIRDLLNIKICLFQSKHAAAFTTIHAALASLPQAGPNFISVSGTCAENVTMFGRTDLSIVGNPSATVIPGNPNGRLLAISNSQRIGIQNLTFDGGRGVSILDNSRVDFITITVQNSLSIGMTSIDSLVHIADTTIKNSVRSGISVGGGTFYVDSDVTGTTVTANGRTGISVLTGHLILNGGDGVTPGTENVISNNGLVGVAVANSAEADINGDNRITGNQGAFGLEVLHTSTVMMSDGTISSNDGGGRCHGLQTEEMRRGVSGQTD